MNARPLTEIILSKLGVFYYFCKILLAKKDNMQNFTFNEIVEFLQSGNNKTKEQAEKEFANWLAKNDKFDLVPENVAQRLFDETAISKAKDLLLKANFEVLEKRSKKGQKN